MWMVLDVFQTAYVFSSPLADPCLDMATSLMKPMLQVVFCCWITTSVVDTFTSPNICGISRQTIPHMPACEQSCKASHVQNQKSGA